MAGAAKGNVKRYIYITKWVNEMEKYVKFDSIKDDYVKVDIAKAQVFMTPEDAQKFADDMYDFGYDRPEVVQVIDT